MWFQIGLFFWELSEIRDMFHLSVFEQIGIGMAYLHVFLITMHEIDTAAEVYLEPFQTYLIELFCKNI